MPWKKQDVERTLTRVFWNSECFKACEILQIIRLIVIRTFRDYSCPVTDELIFIPRRDFPRGKWWRVPQQSAVSNRKGDEKLERATTTTALLQLLRLPSGASVVVR